MRRSAWLTLGSAIGRLVPLGVLLVASRQVDSQTFASVSAGFAWAGVAVSLSTAGRATVMTQRLGSVADAAAQSQMFSHHLRLASFASGGLALIVWLFGEDGGRWLFRSALDVRVVLPAAVAGALWSQVAICLAALNGCHHTRTASSTLAICGLLQGITMATALALSGSASAMVWGLAVGSGIAASMAHVLVRRLLPQPGYRIAIRTAGGNQSVWWRSPVLWNSIAAWSVFPVSFFGSSLITRGVDGGRQLAQYFALEQVHQVAIYIPGLVGQALLPMVSQRLQNARTLTERSQLQRDLCGLALVAAGAGLLFTAAITADTEWFVDLLRNPALDTQDAWAVRWMLANASLALSLSLLGGAMLGRGSIIQASLMNLSYGLLFAGGTVLLSSHGNVGLQVARLASSLALVLVAATALWRHARCDALEKP